MAFDNLGENLGDGFETTNLGEALEVFDAEIDIAIGDIVDLERDCSGENFRDNTGTDLGVPLSDLFDAETEAFRDVLDVDLGVAFLNAFDSDLGRDNLGENFEDGLVTSSLGVALGDVLGRAFDVKLVADLGVALMEV